MLAASSMLVESTTGDRAGLVGRFDRTNLTGPRFAWPASAVPRAIHRELDLGPGPHDLTLHRRNEAGIGGTGVTTFLGSIHDPAGPGPAPPRRIEINFLEMPGPLPSEGTGCGGHPLAVTHKRMSDALVMELRTKLGCDHRGLAEHPRE